MDLTLVLQNNQNAGVVWVGISGRQLGKLPPSESMDLKLNVIATIPGLQVQANILLPFIQFVYTTCISFIILKKRHQGSKWGVSIYMAINNSLI